MGILYFFTWGIFFIGVTLRAAQVSSRIRADNDAVPYRSWTPALT